MIGSKHVAIAYLLSIAVACVWIPWRVPIPQDRDKPSGPVVPSREMSRLGYGWLWSGSRSLLRNLDAEARDPKFLALENDLDEKQGTNQANFDAFNNFARLATVPEVEQAVRIAKINGQTLRDDYRAYYLGNESPDFRIIGLTIGGLSAVAALCFLLAALGRSTIR